MKPIVSVIPIFHGSDRGTRDVFVLRRNELDAITGQHVLVALANSIIDDDSYDIAAAVNSKRFPGLRHADLPCIWVETIGEHFVVPLHGLSDNDIHRMLRLLVDLVIDGTPFSQLSGKLMELKKGPTLPPNPWKAGSFVFIVALAVLLEVYFVAQGVSALILPVVLIGALLLVLVVGILTLALQGQLQDKSFIEAIRLVLASLPLLRGRRNDPEPKRDGTA